MTTTSAHRSAPPTVASRPVPGRRLVPVLRRRLPARTAARAGVCAFVLFVASFDWAVRGGGPLWSGPLRVTGLALCCAGLALAAWAPRPAVLSAAAGLAVTAVTGTFPLGCYAAAVAALAVAARSERRTGAWGLVVLAGFFGLGQVVPGGQGDNLLPSFSDPAGALWLLAALGAAGVLAGLVARRRTPGAAGPRAAFLGRLPVVLPIEVAAVAAVAAVTALRWAGVFGTPMMRFGTGAGLDILSPWGSAAVIAVFCLGTSAVALSPWFPRAGFATAVVTHLVLLLLAYPGRFAVVPGLTGCTVAALYVLARSRLQERSTAGAGSAGRTAALLAVSGVLAATLALAQQVTDFVRESFAQGMAIGDLGFDTTPGTLVWIVLHTFAASAVVPALVVAGAWLVTRWLADRDRLSTAATREAAAAERTRIARELHDVVAHHVSLVTVRAESAPFLVPDLPGPARDAFGEIASTSRRALDELRDVLGVLGRDGGVALAPQPTLTDVPGLVAAARDAGADVAFAGLPDAADVPAATALAAHAVVREALSNARRHAPGEPVTVALTADGGTLAVEVSNPVGTASGREGLGLAGLRERVEAAGGTFAAGPGAGRFTVVARLPLRRPDVA